MENICKNHSFKFERDNLNFLSLSLPLSFSLSPYDTIFRIDKSMLKGSQRLSNSEPKISGVTADGLKYFLSDRDLFLGEVIQRLHELVEVPYKQIVDGWTRKGFNARLIYSFFFFLYFSFPRFDNIRVALIF